MWDDAPTGGGADLTVIADDDGAGASDHTECREENNSFLLAGVSCP